MIVSITKLFKITAKNELITLEHHALKNVKNCLNTNIYSLRDIWWSKL